MANAFTSFLTATEERLTALLKAYVRHGYSPDTIKEMDATFGPSSYGDRTEVAAKLHAAGGAQHPNVRALVQNPEPGSLGHAFKSFIGEALSLRRQKLEHTRHTALHTDSIQGPIDPEDLHRNAAAFASYHQHVEQKMGGVADANVDTLRRSPKHGALIQQKANHIIARDRSLAEQGLHPIHTMRDMDTLATVVHKQPEMFSEQERNHFHVMHEALKIRAATHADVLKEAGVSEQEHPFRPSWSSLDTTALTAMHKAARQLHHVGSNSDYLARVTGAALQAQARHPAPLRSPDSARWKGPQDYPALHPADSALFKQSEAEMGRLYKRRGAGVHHEEAPAASIPVASSAPSSAVMSAAPATMTPQELLAHEKAKRAAKHADRSNAVMESARRDLISALRSDASPINANAAAKRARDAFEKALPVQMHPGDQEDPIMAPALRLSDGTVIVGNKNHADVARAAVKAGHNRSDIARALLFDREGSGFVTKSGRYLPRDRAFHVARAHGQFKDAEIDNIDPHTLDSGDLEFRKSFVELADAIRRLDYAA